MQKTVFSELPLSDKKQRLLKNEAESPFWSLRKTPHTYVDKLPYLTSVFLKPCGQKGATF